MDLFICRMSSPLTDLADINNRLFECGGMNARAYARDTVSLC